jgi:hypothetical protein
MYTTKGMHMASLDGSPIVPFNPSPKFPSDSPLTSPSGILYYPFVYPYKHPPAEELLILNSIFLDRLAEHITNEPPAPISYSSLSAEEYQQLSAKFSLLLFCIGGSFSPPVQESTALIIENLAMLKKLNPQKTSSHSLPSNPPSMDTEKFYDLIKEICHSYNEQKKNTPPSLFSRSAYDEFRHRVLFFLCNLSEFNESDQKYISQEAHLACTLLNELKPTETVPQT